MIYLLHFDRPFHHARHYLGFCEDGNLEQRLKRHQQSDGSKLLRAVKQAGISWQLVRTWPTGTRDQERAIKNAKCTPKYCPICRAAEKVVNDENQASKPLINELANKV